MQISMNITDDQRDKLNLLAALKYKGNRQKLMEFVVKDFLDKNPVK